METINFSGTFLVRGFWAYSWKIESAGRILLYIGRTGDSSSTKASSPYRRFSQHLNDSERSKSNALYRNLVAEGLDPKTCRYTFAAVGPLRPEEPEISLHRKSRDEMAALEHALAGRFNRLGYKVLGNHPRHGTTDLVELDSVFQKLRTGLGL